MGEAESYADGDPRLALSPTQWRGVRAFARGDSIDVVARGCGVSPNRVRRWLKTPRFRKAVVRERVQPTARSFAKSIMREGLQSANTAQRALQAGTDKEATDGQG